MMVTGYWRPQNIYLINTDVSTELDLNFGPKITEGRRFRQINWVLLFQYMCFNRKNTRHRIEKPKTEDPGSQPGRNGF